MMRFYAQWVRPGDLVFDVGANFGARTAAFLGLGARVVAVDPQERCIAELRARFGNHDRVKIVQTALGATQGEATMLVSNALTVSSLSPQWVDKVKASGRFEGCRWDKQVIVPVTRMDDLITAHGLPAFVKIDVEGFELEVLRGLSKSVPAISYEFVGEAVETAIQCASHLHSLGLSEFNFSFGESMSMQQERWLDIESLSASLRALPCDDIQVWGDVYARQSKRA
jgi:FkbM family methyltransferase